MQFCKARRKMQAFYKELFDSYSEISILNEPSKEYFSNHWLTAILMKSEKQREDLRLALEKENIESRPIWKPMHLQPVFEKYPYYGKKNAETIFQNGLCLPSGSNLNEEDKERIKKAIILQLNN